MSDCKFVPFDVKTCISAGQQNTEAGWLVIMPDDLVSGVTQGSYILITIILTLENHLPNQILSLLPYRMEIYTEFNLYSDLAQNGITLY